jgi:hypothetical protein
LYSDEDGPPVDAYDCIILTQTLQCIFDLGAALRTTHRLLRSGGVLLATAPGISQISRFDMDRWGDYWRFTTLSMGRLTRQVFGDDRVSVSAYGNVLSATAFLQGLAVQELRRDELEHRDPDYQLLVVTRAVK